MHHIRTFLACDEIACFVFGQAGIHQGPDLGVLAIGVRAALAPSPGERVCGTLADIWLLGMTGWEFFRAISCHSFWWDAARGETRELIRAALNAGQAWILGGGTVGGVGRFCFSKCYIKFYKYMNILQSGPADRRLAH